MACYSNTPGLVDMPCVSTKKSFDNISLLRFSFSSRIYILVTCLLDCIYLTKKFREEIFFNR